MAEAQLPQELIFNPNDYQKGSQIGHGTFGDVFIAENRETHQLFAVKISKFPSDSPGFRFQEIIVLSQNNYPALVSLKGYSPVNFDGENYPMILLDLFLEGSLLKYMRGDQSNRSDTNDYIFLLGTAIALRHLHSNHKIHRDVKPENILIDNNFYPIISDFGTSKQKAHENMETISQTLFTTFGIGSPLYMAPEIIDEIPYETHSEVNFNS